MLKPALRPPMRAPMRSANAPREGVGGAWLATEASLRAYLATTDGADNPHSLVAMASPPTITTDTTTTPAVAYTRTLTMATPADLAQVLVESGDQTINSNFLQPVQATQASGVVARTASRVSVNINADVVAFYVIGVATAYRFLVDDQYVDFTGTVAGATSGTGNNYIILTFASKAVRKVTVELQQGCAIRRIHIKTGDSYGAKPTAKAHRGVIFGDSITAASGATAFGDGYVQIAGDYLGVPDLVPSGVGSTGYVNTATGTRYKLSERISADLDRALAAGSLSFVVVAMGINDLGLSGIQAEAEACYAIIRAKCPAALVFVLPPWDASAPTPASADYIAAKAAITAAVGSRGGFRILDAEGVEYTKSSGVHPDTSGHDTLGLWLDEAIRLALAA